jgi:hypothetical protein
MIVTEETRKAVQEAKEKIRTKMSERLKAQLSLTKETQNRFDVGNLLFAQRVVQEVPKDTWTLVQLLGRLSTDQNHLHRRANKLRLSLAHGWYPCSLHDIMFLADLTRDESAMTEGQFYARLEAQWPEEIVWHGQMDKLRPSQAL